MGDCADYQDVEREGVAEMKKRMCTNCNEFRDFVKMDMSTDVGLPIYWRIIYICRKCGEVYPRSIYKGLKKRPKNK